jgi:transposase
MQIRDRRCCGIDVHKKTTQVCVLPAQGQTHVKPLEREYRTFMRDLRRLGGGLKSCGVTELVMESTGVYFALSSALIGRVQVPPALR